MRCHFSDKDETISDPTGCSIWSSNIQNPNILHSVENVNDVDAKLYSDALPTLYSLDSVSKSYKRKILECEKEDFEEKFNYFQRKRQMLKATLKPDFVIDEDCSNSDDDDDLNESEIYEQMEWIEEKNAMAVQFFKNKDNLSAQNLNSESSLLFLPKLNLREERHHLLRISMAKIRGVDDPETYLRRSVLIKNTVNRLQNDVAISYSLASSPIFYDSISCERESNIWGLEKSSDGIVCKPNYSDGNSFEYARYLVNSDSTGGYNSEVQTAAPYNFNLSVITPFSSDKIVAQFPNEVLQNSIFPKSLQEDQNDSLLYRTFKPANTVHVFSSQPCGLQYRNTSHEDTDKEYPEASGSSSILDSVVYHSLIASLES